MRVKVTKVYFFTLTLTLAGVTLWTLMNFIEKNDEKKFLVFKEYFQGNFSHSYTKEKEYKVLFWTPFFRSYAGWNKFYGYYNATACRWHCEFTSRRSHLSDSSVVIFNARDVYLNYSDMPRSRKLAQIWLLHNTEPPWFTFLNMKYFNHIFNWTSFLRRDSDIPTYYSKTVKKPSTNERYNSSLLLKPKLVSWMASNCITVSRREDYIRNLRKYIQVDRFGKCGELACLYGGNRCNGKLKDYKFYLAFENSNCRDYVTEKFWRTLQLGVIPVVMGNSGGHQKVAPPNSFINTDDFQSPKHLAEYLLKVGSNQELFDGYFKWKENYAVELGYWCDFCRQLHEWDGRPQVYTDLNGWFRQDTCVPWNEDAGKWMHLCPKISCLINGKCQQYKLQMAVLLCPSIYMVPDSH